MVKEVGGMHNTLLPTNKLESGYVLSITLLMMSVILLIVASLLKCQMLTSSYHATWKETASTKFMTENKAVQEQAEVVDLYEQLQEALYNQYVNLYPEELAFNKEAFQILSAAQAYVLTTQTFFYKESGDGYLYSTNLVEESFEVGMPYMDESTRMKVKCKKYTGNVHFATNPSKDGLVSYDEVKKQIKRVEVALAKGEAIGSEKVMTMIKNLKNELMSKPMYEIGITTQVAHDVKGVLERKQIYVILKLVEKSLEEGLPYRLQVDNYKMI